jgi:hypothetical protein
MANSGLESTIQEWLPSDVTLSEIEEHIWHRTLRPTSLPVTRREEELELGWFRFRLAAAAAKISHRLQAKRSIGPKLTALLLRGKAIGAAGGLGPVLIYTLDTLGLWGTMEIIEDRHNVLPALGILASERPDIVVDLLDGPAIGRPGWVVAPRGTLRSGETAIQIRLEGEKRRMKTEVASGDLRVIPLKFRDLATITVEPAGRLDVGAGPGKSVKLAADRPGARLIVDARGRPLSYSAVPELRHSYLTKWLEEVRQL